MAEEIQIPECNGDRHPEIPQTTNIIDQMDTLMVYESRESDPVVPRDSKDGPGTCLEDKTDSLGISTESTKEELHTEPDAATEQESDTPTSHNIHSEEKNNGEECQAKLEVEGDNAPAHDFPGQEEINEQEEDQKESKAEAQDILIYDQAETREEDTLTETEEENTSIETDNDNGQGSSDEHENGPEQAYSVSPSGSHLESNSEQHVPGNISKNSYSRYDTVSYRKIRKGNTKQRIDEFESMMN